MHRKHKSGGFTAFVNIAEYIKDVTEPGWRLGFTTTASQHGKRKNEKWPKQNLIWTLALSVTSMVPAILGFVPIFHFPVRRACFPLSVPRSPLPPSTFLVLVTSGKADSYYHTLFSIWEITVNPLLSYPRCQRVFFSCCLRRKLSREVAIVTSVFFFPARHDSGFAAQFSPQTTAKKTSGIQGTIKPPRWPIYLKHVWGGEGVLIERGGLFSLAKHDAILPFKRPEDDINSPYKELKGYEVWGVVCIKYGE